MLRKLRGLAESSEGRVAIIGSVMLERFERLKEAVYEARNAGPPGQAPAQAMSPVIEALRDLCERHQDDRHDALREVAREFSCTTGR